MGPTFYDPSHSITIYRKTRIYCNFRLCTCYYFKFYPPFMGVNESNSRNISCKTTRYFNCFFFITLIVSQLLTNRHDINNFISNAAKLVLAHLCIHPNPIYHCVGEKKMEKIKSTSKLILISCITFFSLTGCLQKTLSMMYNLFKEPYLTLQKIIK